MMNGDTRRYLTRDEQRMLAAALRRSARTINEGGQAPCESTDGCTRAQVTLEQAISHAGTDHAMAAQPVPPSPAQPRASCPKEARGELCSCYFSGPHSYCPFADGGPLASTAQGEPQEVGIANNFASLECVLNDANEQAAETAAAIVALRAERDALRALLLETQNRRTDAPSFVRWYSEWTARVDAAIDAARGKP